MEVFLIRHGETVYNELEKIQGWTDSPLTNRGIEEARIVGRSLAHVKFQAIYTSDIGRAVKTAEIVSELNLVSQVVHPKPTSDFREEFFGSFEGKDYYKTWRILAGEVGLTSFHQVVEKYSLDFARDLVHKNDITKAAENSTMFWTRICHGLGRIYKTHDVKDRVLLVTHSNVIRSIVERFGEGDFDLGFDVKNASVTKLRMENPKSIYVTDFGE